MRGCGKGGFEGEPGVRGAEMGVRGVVRVVVGVVVAGKIGAKRRQRAGVMGAALGWRCSAGLLDGDGRGLIN
jgi:hypothetical protein